MRLEDSDHDWSDVRATARGRSVREYARAIIGILIVLASAVALAVAILYRSELGEWGLPAGFLLGTVMYKWMTPVIRHYFPSRHNDDEELDSF